MPTFQYNNIRFYYDDHGSGVPIVFVHPPGMGRKVFYHQYALANQFRVLMIDLSGHGDTIGVTKKVTMKAFAKEIVALLDHLSIEKAVICGYSSGGCVAQEFALSYQDRTIALILAGGFPEIRSAFLRAEHHLGMYFVKYFPKMLTRTIAASHTTNLRLRKMLEKHMDKANRKTWYLFYKKSLTFSCLTKLQQLKIPLLLLYGSKDLTNQHVRTYRKMTNAQEKYIKKAHHQLPFKNWYVFNQSISQFLDSQTVEVE